MTKLYKGIRLASMSLVPFLLAGVLQAQKTAPAIQATPIPTSPTKLRTTTPLEQLVSQTRKKNGDITVHSVRLAGQEQQRTYIINYVNADRQWMRTVYDAHTGKLLDNVSLRTPMPVEQSLIKLHNKYPSMTLLRTWLDQRNGELTRIVELTDAKNKRWEVTQDPYTGQVLNELAYDIALNGKEVSLAQILAKVREQHKGMIVLQTRSTVKNNIRVREISYLDENKVRRKMTVNMVTGETISDRIMPVLPI
ncbi:hypothetical protein ACH42_11465 [Endozoicomonas sp. (ex Bugula neritina AB1)]|nr:hypothetical protein ACH42_11465 [Endozoicomonas sp. (ex Bugula neritina AB1)]